ncbi:non-ribosomal peptide synthetase [Streptomyces sp. AN091965]|uniref:non-ribosomal peptide synthetase n=1 Tax=Streptomyces sp. AN091965 TaxID=2927803 RepID=UPI001F61EB2F|nr:non-ribosomal peptide synthetase [Streptomyces sp. AN091965]MCI3928031.1 amino acid adenylation domain-containing protein [Streptomyces sp. AN091965]
MSDTRGLSVAVEPLSDETIPALFERQVALTPDACALVLGTRQMTYRQLDEQANQLAQLLIGRGVVQESVVAVALQRSPEYVVTVLAILKAGGAYLPVDPAYPAERIDFMLRDAAPTVVVTDAGTARRLPENSAPRIALDEPNTLTALTAAARDGSPTATRGGHPDHIAYVIYTSGSTGKPKGVGVTHRGVVSLAVDGRYRDGAYARVLQHAPLAFDASTFELWVPLLAGGAVVVARPGLLDAPALAEAITAHEVTAMFVSAGLFKAVAEEQPDCFRGLRAIWTGGDVVSPTAVRRVLDACPGVTLHDVYGPTEVSVYATCRPMSAAHEVREPIPIGRFLDHRSGHVLDERLRPVAAGEPGELYLTGPGLARGYLGRRALTAERFLADPFGQPGARMYRTGDLVAWTPDGELDFRGRADAQVKIRGFRVEPGEIETLLEQHPAVAHALVVPHETTSRGKQLVAYVVPTPAAAHAATAERGAGTGHFALDAGFGAGELRAFAARTLPEHLLPAAFTVIDELPLTANGKLDRAGLPEPEFRGAAYRAPRTEREERLAALFAEVLGVERVGVDDDFFTIGGDSIQSIQLATRARARGLALGAQDLFEHRTVTRLAEAVADAVDRPAAVLDELPGGGAGFLPHLPVTRWVRDWGPGFERFLQAMVLDLPEGIDAEGLSATLGAVVDRHDLLRARPVERDGGGLEVGPPGSVAVAGLIRRVECDGAWDAEPWREELLHEVDAAAGRLDPASGVVAQFVWFDAGPRRAGRLLVALHHMVVDGVSWRILMPDLATAWRHVREGRTPELPPVGTSMRRWAHALVEEAARPKRTAELELWRTIVDGPDPVLGARRLDPEADTVSTLTKTRVHLPPEVTEALLTTLPAAFRGGVNDGLLAALAVAITQWRRTRGVDEDSALIRLEGHGREEAAAPGADLTRTVGWFTSVFPVRLDVSGTDADEVFAGGAAAGRVVKAVKEQLLALPDKGIGYGLLRHLNPETADVLKEYGTGQISFNYLGRFSTASEMPEELRGLGFTQAPGLAELAELDAGQDPRMAAPAELDINAHVTDTPEGPRLGALFTAPQGVLGADDVQELADLWCAALKGLARHVAAPDAGGLTPSDVTMPSAAQCDIDGWEQRYPGLSDVWPTSPLQAGLLFHSKLAAESGAGFDAYHEQYVLHLSGAVDPARLRIAAQALLDRHAALRTAFVPGPGGGLAQLVVDGVAVPWTHRDLSGLDDGERERAYEQFLADDLGVHFDPAAPPMLRFTHLTLEADRHELVLTVHHVLVDGWSLPLLIQDLLSLYAGEGDATGLPRARSYRAYLTWLEGRDAQDSGRAWARELDGVTEPTLLAPGALDAPGSGIGQADVPLTATQARALTQRAGELGVTLNTLIQGAWGILLGGLTGRADVVFSATVSGRPPALPGVDETVGMFLNTVPVRVRCAPGASFAQLLTDLQRAQAALIDHHHLGLTEIQRTTGLSPLFDTMIAFESFPLDRAGIGEASEAAGFSVTGIRSFSASHYPVTVFVYPDGPHPSLTLQYQRHAFEAEAAATLAARFAGVLAQLTEDPQAPVGRVDLLVQDERDASTGRLSDTAPPRTWTTVPEMWERQAAETPDATAVVCGDQHLTYRQLNERVQALAAELTARGARPESVVGLALPRSADLVTGMLAILTAGACYLPIDPAYPSGRLDLILGQARPALLLTDTATAQALPHSDTPRLCLDDLDLQATADRLRQGEAGHTAPPRPDHLAYVMYTSGSTGTPKGVMITQAGVVNGITQLAERVGIDASTRMLAGTSVNFDVSVFEILTTLSRGGRVEVVRDAMVLAERQDLAADVISTVPSVFVELGDRMDAITDLKTVVFAGEALPAALVHRIRRTLPWVRVVNAYGQSESFYATTFTADEGWQGTGSASAPIGTPVGNMRTYVLGPALNPLPPGVVGELYVAGAIGRGYYQRSALTADRFVADSYGPAGERMYRTGDLARWNAEGRLEYVGRADDQVKIRGVRVEPAEVEAALAGHPGVAQAVVVAHDSPTGTGKHLVGYLVPATPDGGGGPEEVAALTEEVRGHLQDRLPTHMVPAAVVPLAELPLTPNGKVDRKALPAPDLVGTTAYRAPRNPQEARLCSLFAEVLGAERVGIDDNFFDLGGHSLLAVNLVNHIRNAFRVDVPISAVLNSRDVAGLSRTIRDASATKRPKLRAMNRSAK